MADSDRDTAFLHGVFPAGFVWSTATASYQIEGAWNEDGKGPNIWDTFSHQHGNVFNGDTGDVACDSYHNFQQDVQLIKSLGTSHYRFSLSWSRLLPDGTVEHINQKGVDFYNRMINALKEAGIEPMVTLYHWDLPQVLQDRGGWLSEDIVKHFADYARLCFKEFGDRVKFWITFNEPLVFVWEGHASGVHAPGIKDPLNSTFKAAHNFLRSHARAYHLYDEQFRDKQKGKCGITMNVDWCEPKNPSDPADRKAAEDSLAYKFGWFANPVYGDGDYPDVLKQLISERCRELGLPKSTLPEFTEVEKALLKGSSDFFGLNHYTTRYVRYATPEDIARVEEEVSEVTIMGIVSETDPSWKRAGSEWLYIVPWGLRRILRWIKEHYNNIPVYITENGVSDITGDLNDQHRIEYYKSYINEVLKAVLLDGCDVKGYTAWSLLDNFEWARGYSERFGLHHVDYNDPARKRTPKESAKFYAQLIKDNGFPK